eukprot:CAMPEP_0172443714 /NCGR_PEP_ID=MMETSP1065-20121228/3929_1 /TAXON_ID=265537 /ORGANISM="Amphiprora paludosa, Strain CCMP125" /LENGTH=1500 /DNA_ID=CAMNT_0013194039 /DNA_START=53 /DNA_END=4555 /DNA_ORIENTATION=+
MFGSFSPSRTKPETSKTSVKSDGLTASETERLQSRIQQLLTLCAQNELDIPEELKQSLLEPQDDTVVGLSTATVAASQEHHVLESMIERASLVVEQEVALIKEYREKMQVVGGQLPVFDLRIQDGSYRVMIPDRDKDVVFNPGSRHMGVSSKGLSSDSAEGDANGGGSSRSVHADPNIPTLRNSNPVYALYAMMVRCIFQKGSPKIPQKERIIMDKVNLVLEPSKMYLVLGAPGSGKSTLLKMIANNLSQQKGETASGQVSINGVTPMSKQEARKSHAEGPVIWSNLVGYIDQIDRLHPWLTVWETCEFAWKCRSGGTHREPWFDKSPEADAMIATMDENMEQVTKILQGLGLTRVKDTFVGDQSTVRGVSGGEKKRVTVAEMFCVGTPVVCCDEISTGLDAATTFDITKLMRQATRVRNSTLIVSLLQPPPETVANFDELILLSEGKIIYAGPVDYVLEHFESLGYELPDRMDVADWLQALPTKDGAAFLKKPRLDSIASAGSQVGTEVAPHSEMSPKHLTTDEFVQKFYESEQGQEIMAKLASPMNEGKDADFVRDIAKNRYANPTLTSLKLVIQRELLLWWRDKYQLKAKIGQNLILGVVVGTIFWDASVGSLIGVMFQSMFIQIIGAMLLIVKQFPYRSILYKQQDANFFPTWTYVAGRSVANIPNSLIDSVLFGTFIFWFTNMAFGDGASILIFFMWLIILFMTSYSTGLFFGIFPAGMADVTLAQAAMAVLVVIFILFSGFAIQPDVIPDWYIWAYWLNPVSWVFRGLAVNEFDSGAYDDPAAPGSALTLGEQILVTYGFTDSNDDPYQYIWAGYAVFFLIGISFIAMIITVICYTHIRFSTGKGAVLEIDEEAEEAQAKVGDSQTVSPIPFKCVDLTFRDMHYTVKSSISKESLELLKGIDGVVEAGKMTALMGSSGAGKTTLMDVLAMRKSSGEIEGEIRLNGHLQEEESFRRTMGYVEQFDVQSEQLTIRETVEFSARLRLDASDPAVTPESTKAFVDATLSMLELTVIEGLQVGSDDTGGLSFEQNKRLSIAVELVANPSILFLDEPTSGLDARAAMIVMRGLKRIASSGRAVCATIHQPSVSIFEDFDSLLLLKRGGEVVFHGELGAGSSHLIEYLERFDSTPKIQRGENPATWMLTTIGAGSSSPGASGQSFDYAGAYHSSKLRKQCLDRIEKITSGATEENKIEFSSKYATGYWAQSSAVLNRAMTIYLRSPTYNITRNIVSVVVAIIFGTCYINYRTPSNESEMNSVFNSAFIAILFLSVSSQNTVLTFFEKERNMFYRHKAANMYDSTAVLRAYTLAEFPFIMIASLLFVVPFYFMMGFAVDAEKFFLFYCFTYLGFNVFTFTGQMFVSLLRDAETAQAIGGMFVTFSVLFSGLLIRPDEIPVFWEWCYWVFPGHYLFEGIFLTQFHDDDRVIEASDGTPFYQGLGCSPEDETVCEGTIAQWMEINFPDWSRDNVYYCGIYLAVLIILTRLVTFWALGNLNYRST